MVLSVHGLEIGFRSARRAGAHAFGGLRVLELQKSEIRGSGFGMLHFGLIHGLGLMILGLMMLGLGFKIKDVWFSQVFGVRISGFGLWVGFSVL